MKKIPIEFLNHIFQRIARIEELLGVISSKEAFESDWVVQDAMIREIEVIGEACKNLRQQCESTYPEIPWKEIVAMRNALIHEYWEVDLDQVWVSANDDIPRLKTLLSGILMEFKDELQNRQPQAK